MAKLNGREMNAVVMTVIQQIHESKKDSPIQREYERLVNLQNTLNKEIQQRRIQFEKDLKDEFEQLSEGLKLKIDQYTDRVSVLKPSAPEFQVDEQTIERELIIANISGNIQETMEQIVTKYTK